MYERRFVGDMPVAGPERSGPEDRGEIAVMMEQLEKAIFLAQDALADLEARLAPVSGPGTEPEPENPRALAQPGPRSEIGRTLEERSQNVRCIANRLVAMRLNLCI